ncbi:GNAT family N-acetyltransferase [soil metagenome]
MKPEDAEAVYHAASTALFESPEDQEVLHRRTPEEVKNRKARYKHSLRHDPEGAWVAEDDGRISGVAIALVRERVWVLSLLAVDADHRNTGLGKSLLERALAYGDGCKGAMIASSQHPAAMRRYASAGFDLHPTLTASGVVRRESIPSGLAVRDGEVQDLELAAEVDRAVRGAAHGPDLEHMIETSCRLLVAEGPSGRGYAAGWNGSPAVLAATKPEVARDLLWACLEKTPPGEKAEVDWITGRQNWAVPVTLEAGLSLSSTGPICTRGELGPLTPYLPSGPFL